MNEISLFRLNLLRVAYVVLVFGLGSIVWPSILDPATTWPLKSGVVVSMLGALSALALLGFRYPLQMLPILLFELAWKAIWLVRIGLPLWFAHRMDAATADTFSDVIPIVLFPLLIPWSYVLHHYVRKPGDPWMRRERPAAAPLAP
jgi:hypothetical protein